ncbi:hypothetical protein J2810_004227 [Chryseobacterium rhizosphaerae]|uniref:hypothetical protein n=1 Tax=Chryseobacterium rhizosphaerae TaxID=395937 RepID=UPI002860BCE9|nr:hypothetical protein [Chryseobacterium rhizosphaerae]MDR6548140.1 hypothetical protein [Chryseobacterium rhizosphaerae]
MKFNWLIDRLNEDRNISTSLNEEKTILTIVRKNRDESLTISSVSSTHPSLDDIIDITKKYNTDFILVKKDSIINGDILEFLEKKEKTIGSYGDVFRIMNQEDNFPYLPPEIKFILRNLKQHTKVRHIKRLDTKRYLISRYGLEDVTVIALYDYDLGVEAIRSAIDIYRDFDAIFKGNPNGRISEDAYKLANSMKIKTLMWGELLSELNKKWT